MRERDPGMRGKLRRWTCVLESALLPHLPPHTPREQQQALSMRLSSKRRHQFPKGMSGSVHGSRPA